VVEVLVLEPVMVLMLVMVEWVEVLLPVGALLAGAALEVVVAEDEVVVVVGGLELDELEELEIGSEEEVDLGLDGSDEEEELAALAVKQSDMIKGEDALFTKNCWHGTETSFWRKMLTASRMLSFPSQASPVILLESLPLSIVTMSNLDQPIISY
jgi:hypothetical protein